MRASDSVSPIAVNEMVSGSLLRANVAVLVASTLAMMLRDAANAGDAAAMLAVNVIQLTIVAGYHLLADIADPLIVLLKLTSQLTLSQVANGENQMILTHNKKPPDQRIRRPHVQSHTLVRFTPLISLRRL
jgi:hypothetical protein